MKYISIFLQISVSILKIMLDFYLKSSSLFTFDDMDQILRKIIMKLN